MTLGPMTRRWIWIVLLLIWSLGPMLWQLVSSFTTADALVNDQMSFWSRWTLNNYRDLLSTDPPFWRYLFNSSFVASLTTLITLMLPSPPPTDWPNCQCGGREPCEPQWWRPLCFPTCSCFSRYSNWPARFRWATT